MDNTERLISIYHTGFVVSAILLVAGILLAILFFFLFDIRTIFLIRTGRAKQQTIDEMKEKNLQTGRLGVDSPYTPSGELKKKDKKRNTGAFRIPGTSKGVVIEKPREESLQTAPLSEEQDKAALVGGAPAGGVSAGAASYKETGVPGASPSQAAPYEETVLDQEQPAPGSILAGRQEPARPEAAAAMLAQSGAMETAVLSDAPGSAMAPAAAAPGFRFVVTERKITVHTSEVI